MKTRAKICGLSTLDTLDAAIAGGASHIGFNFFPPSPRYVSIEQAAALALRVPDHVAKVAVVVDPDDALLSALAPIVDAIQLHGSESPQRAASVKRLTACEVWKAVPVRTRADLSAASAYRGAADHILYDAKPPKGADLPGGLGLRFDWTLLDGHDHPLPWALSGGLDAANVREAIGITRAGLVDVASGVESAPGVKDARLIADFLRAVAG